jgi:very-short-patch-repair endonuclease
MLPHHASIRHARQMRKNLTPPEARLWQALRRKGVSGLKFRRQHPIGPFILDFFCASARLAIEVDGVLHDCDDNPARDERRDLWLERHGLTVLRVPASAIRDNLEGVLALIAQRAAHAGQGPAEGPFVARSGDTSPEGGRDAFRRGGPR